MNHRYYDRHDGQQFSRPLAITEVSSTGDVLTLAEAKRHLGVTDDRHDDEIAAMVLEAQDWCENIARRTFRQAVVRRLEFGAWPPHFVPLSRPPCITVASIKYVDPAGVEQTLPDEQYEVHLSAATQTRIWWTGQFARPGLDGDSVNAISVEWTSGYAVPPPSAKSAVKFTLSWMYDQDQAPAQLDTYRERAIDLLSLLHWEAYS